MMRMKRFALVCLIMAAMAAGFVTRSHVNQHDPLAKIQREEAMSCSLSASAPNSGLTDIGSRSDVDLRPLQVFCQVLLRLRQEYVEPIQKSREHEMTYGALNYMLDSLHDPQTRFFDVTQSKLIADGQEGKFYGIGANILVKQVKQDGITEERLVIASTLQDSPAEKAGLLSGDVITAINGKTVLPYEPFQRVELLVKKLRNGKITDQQFRKALEAESNRLKDGVAFNKVMDMLASKDEKEHTLTVARPKLASPIKIKVASGETIVDPVTEKLINPSTGYIDVNLMVKSAEPEFKTAIADFKKEGVKGIIIDLRDSAGGSLESMQSIAGNLIPKKSISILELPKGKKQILWAGGATATKWAGKVVVLVDSGTTGLSEVLAAALRDGAGAKLVGEKTFGASLQQAFMKLPDGSAVSMTTGKYLTAKGIDFKDKGLAADVIVPSGAKSAPDQVLNRGVELLNSGKAKG